MLHPAWTEELRRLSEEVRDGAAEEGGEEPVLESLCEVSRELAAANHANPTSEGEQEQASTDQAALDSLADDMDAMGLVGDTAIASMGVDGHAGRAVVTLTRVGDKQHVEAMEDGGTWRNTIEDWFFEEIGGLTKYAHHFVYSPVDVVIGHGIQATQFCYGAVMLPVLLTPRSTRPVHVEFYIMHTSPRPDSGRRAPPVYIAASTINARKAELASQSHLPQQVGSASTRTPTQSPGLTKLLVACCLSCLRVHGSAAASAILPPRHDATPAPAAPPSRGD